MSNFVKFVLRRGEKGFREVKEGLGRREGLIKTVFECSRLEFDCVSSPPAPRREKIKVEARRIRGNRCRTEFAIERSSLWRFMRCRERLLVTP